MYISIFFYLYGVASILPPNMTDISGYWAPVNDVQANCIGPFCDNSTTIRTTFQPLGDNTWVEKVLVGTGNCMDPNFVNSLTLVVESYGTLVVDLNAIENDSLPINFAPQPGIIMIPAPLIQTVPVPVPEPFVAPSINPAPAVNQIPPAPVVNPVPGVVNPVPVPAPDTGDLTPAQLNPSPYIVVHAPGNVPLIPIPEAVFPKEPSPSPQPSMIPVPAVLSSGNFSVWLPVISTPFKYDIYILNEDQPVPYTGTVNGPCMSALGYWQNETVGCPCNGYWYGNGTYNVTSSTFLGGREIVPTQCPSASCPEAFFINDTVKYGNVRLNVTVFQNGTIMNKTLEITKMSVNKAIGYSYGAADVVYVFTGAKNVNGTIIVLNPVVPSNPNPNPNPAPYVVSPGVEPSNPNTNSGSPLPLATTITMIFVFLLMMH